MSDADETRDVWIGTVSRTLFEELHDEREPGLVMYTEEECRHLADFLYDLDVDGKTGDMSPHAMVLREMLVMQGVDQMTAGLLARVMPTIDWARLEVTSARAARLLDVNKTTLLRNRHLGNVAPKSVHYSSKRIDAAVFWLSKVLHIMSWKRQHPWTGGPTPGFPEE